MEQYTLNDLAAQFATDEHAALLLFREMFFAKLERRLLDECQQILDVLGACTSAWLQQEYRYHSAVLLVEFGALDQAEALLRELLAEDQNLLPVQRARVRVELGFVFDEMSQWDEAEHFYLSGLEQYRENDDLLGQAKAHNNLGVLIRFQVEQHEAPLEQLQEALNHHREALALAQQADDAWEATKNWHGQGMIYGLMKEYAAAESAFEQHIALCKSLDNPNDQAISLYDLAALVYQPQQRWDEAHNALAQAIEIFRQFDDGLNLAEALTRLGNLQMEQGQWEQALFAYHQAIEQAESLRTRIMTPTARGGTRAILDATYTAPIAGHLRQGNVGEAFTMVERARARVLADLLSGQGAAPHGAIPETLLTQREAVRVALEQAYASDAPETDRVALEEQLAGFDRRIELVDPTYGRLTSLASLSVEDVQLHLPADAVLLTYVGDTDDQLWVMVVSTKDIHAQPIPGISVGWLRRYLVDHMDGSRRGILVPDPKHPYLDSPRQLFPPLYRALIAPVWNLLESARTIYIIPYGPLHYLPIGALTPDLNSPPPLLTADRRVVYAPSATILLDYCLARAPSPHSEVLAVAPHDSSLQFTQGAARSIVQRCGGTSIVGNQATRQAILDQAGTYQTVCFLGHGLFDSRHPMSSRLLLNDGWLYASEILRDLRLQADLVVLAACETGRGHILRGDEILGMTRALLYAGTPSLLVTLWRVHEIPTRLLIEKLFDQLGSCAPLATATDPATALAIAQQWLRVLSVAAVRKLMQSWDELSPYEVEKHLAELWQMTQHNKPFQDDVPLFAHPFFWSPYILIGDQHPSGG